MLQGLRAICFDLDDTLWDVRPVVEDADRLNQRARELGTPAAHFTREPARALAALLRAGFVRGLDCPGDGP